MDEKDVREFKERIKGIMTRAGVAIGDADTILLRIGARLDGYTHAEAAAMFPMPSEAAREETP